MASTLTSNHSDAKHSELELLLINLINKPPHIIELVLSYMRRDCLGLFLDCEALVPFILPYVKEHVWLSSDNDVMHRPFHWRRFDSIEVDAPVLQLYQLKHVMDSYNVCPREASVDIGAEIRSMLLRGNYAYDEWVSEFIKGEINPSNEALIYLEMFSRIKNWHVIDKAVNEETYTVLAKLGGVPNVRSIGISHHFIFFHYLTRATSMYPETLPDDVLPTPTGMTKLHSENERVSPQLYDYVPYSALKSLKLPVFLGDELTSLPEALEDLSIDLESYDFYNRIDPVLAPPNLKSLEVTFTEEMYWINDLSLLTPNLESFSISGYHDGDLKEFLLPESKLINLALIDCPSLGNISLLKEFKQLIQLTIVNSPIPEKLFESAGVFPRLRRFKFVDPDYVDSPETGLNEAVFPISLTELHVEAAFILDGLKLPPNLRILLLWKCKFPNGISFTIPENVFKLELRDTDLKSMDDIRFPTGLLYLNISGNKYLNSMKNTNLNDLTELFEVVIEGNGDLSGSDKPNTQLLYQRNICT
ncbi:hypothetical protein Cantr_05340 [Candida viswanathii]|uniref:Uncharacterized protein n=1 Tax=Candida viswanathii TaxID=5486 RepID=A0A367XSG0_9ASCO|nr:hypothetical protein Cantr_05340 [Candida viswanathii]